MLSQSSSNSTKGFSHLYETLKKIIKQEAARYLGKGYGLVVALLISLSFFTFIPYFFKSHWEMLISLAEGNEYFFAIFFFVQHHVFFVISNSMMNFLYRFKIHFFECYRVYPDKPWPWEESEEKWRDQRNKTVKVLLFNYFILIPAALCIGFKKERVTFRYDAESFPNLAEMLLQITFIMICDDICFYWLHRLIHYKALYPFIHKIHHEYKNTVAFASEYVHPVDYLANFFPVFVPIRILGRHVHMFTIVMYTTIRYLAAVDDHCGFDFSWSPYRLLPLSGSSAFHNYHHSNNDGNYGAWFTICDTLMGTNQSFEKYFEHKKGVGVTRKGKGEEKKVKEKGVLETKELPENSGNLSFGEKTKIY